MTLYADIDALRDTPAASRALIAQELADELRTATDQAATIDPVLAQLTWLTADEKARANRLIEDGDYPSLGKLLCDAHEQLVAARLLGAKPYRVRLFDEAH
jgi:hypothetical protein